MMLQVQGVLGTINGAKRVKRMMRVGFEPTPFRTRSLVWRLRPLGHLTVMTESSQRYRSVMKDILFMTLSIRHRQTSIASLLMTYQCSYSIEVLPYDLYWGCG